MIVSLLQTKATTFRLAGNIRCMPGIWIMFRPEREPQVFQSIQTRHLRVRFANADKQSQDYFYLHDIARWRLQSWRIQRLKRQIPDGS